MFSVNVITLVVGLVLWVFLHGLGVDSGLGVDTRHASLLWGALLEEWLMWMCHGACCGRLTVILLQKCMLDVSLTDWCLLLCLLTSASGRLSL
jgi:hypothetical protein